MFSFLEDASSAYCKYFQKELESAASRTSHACAGISTNFTCHELHMPRTPPVTNSTSDEPRHFQFHELYYLHVTNSSIYVSRTLSPRMCSNFTNSVCHELYMSRTLSSTCTNGTLESAASRTSLACAKDLTNYICHELYMSRTLSSTYPRTKVESAVSRTSLACAKDLTNYICHELYMSQTLSSTCHELYHPHSQIPKSSLLRHEPPPPTCPRFISRTLSSTCHELYHPHAQIPKSSLLCHEPPPPTCPRFIPRTLSSTCHELYHPHPKYQSQVCCVTNLSHLYAHTLYFTEFIIYDLHVTNSIIHISKSSLLCHEPR